ncbi:MAG: AbrB/MazE/SpoVT family DNA-binding domain-containing protein [Polyangiaceae bacterium]
MSVSTLTSKGQVTLPRDVRDSLHVDAGDKLLWEIRPDGTVLVRKARSRTVSEIAGLLGKPARSVTIEEMDAAIGDYLRDKHRGRR